MLESNTQLSYSFVENATSPLQPPLLLRSLSNTSNAGTPTFCACGSSGQGRFIVEIVTASPFTKASSSDISNLVQMVLARFQNKFECHLSSQVKSAHDEPINVHVKLSNNCRWWDGLFKNCELTPFMHMWATLLSFDKFFRTKSLESPAPVKSSDYINICCNASYHSTESMKENKQSTVLQFCLGSVATLAEETHHQDPTFIWSPCSTAFSMELVLAWARSLIEKTEANGNRIPKELNHYPNISNLARESLGVLENWVDIILLNKLGPLATKSSQIEPDLPSFNEECSSPLADNAVVHHKEEIISIQTDNNHTNGGQQLNRFTIILSDNKKETGSCYSGDWQMLHSAWCSVVERRRTNELDNTMEISLADITDNGGSTIVNSLVDKLSATCK